MIPGLLIVFFLGAVNCYQINKRNKYNRVIWEGLPTGSERNRATLYSPWNIGGEGIFRYKFNTQQLRPEALNLYLNHPLITRTYLNATYDGPEEGFNEITFMIPGNLPKGSEYRYRLELRKKGDYFGDSIAISPLFPIFDEPPKIVSDTFPQNNISNIYQNSSAPLNDTRSSTIELLPGISSVLNDSTNSNATETIKFPIPIPIPTGNNTTIVENDPAHTGNNATMSRNSTMINGNSTSINGNGTLINGNETLTNGNNTTKILLPVDHENNPDSSGYRFSPWLFSFLLTTVFLQ
jgi:hypothetical protein